MSFDRVSTGVVALAFPQMTKRPRPAIVDPIVRAAVLADLALDGALDDSDEGLQIDTTPTGFGPADRLLQAVEAQPNRSLSWWLLHAPVAFPDIARALVQQRWWDCHRARRRYSEIYPDRRHADVAQLTATVRECGATSQQNAVVALLSPLPTGLPTCSGQEDPDLFGRAGWLVPDLVSALYRRQAVIDAAGRDAQTALSANYVF